MLFKSFLLAILIVKVFSLDATLSPVCSNDPVIDIQYAQCTDTRAKQSLYCPEDADGNFHCYSICRYWHNVQPQMSNKTATGIVCTGDSENCTSFCKGSGAKCMGTPAYCNYIGERNCNPSHAENPANCFCELTYYEVEYECKYHGQWHQMNTSHINWQKVHYEFEGPPINPNPFGLVSSTKRSVQSNTFIHFDQPNVTVTTLQPNITFVWVSKAPLNNMYTCSESQCSIRLPGAYFVTPGFMTVSVYLNDVKDSEQVFEIQEMSTCYFPNCVLCWDVLLALDCVPPKAKIALSLTLIGIIIAGACCTPLLFKVLFYLGKWIFNLCKYACCRLYDRGQPILSEGGNTSNRIFINLRNIADHGSPDPVELEEDEIEMTQTPQRRTRPSRLPRWLTGSATLLMFLYLIQMSSAICTEGFTISGNAVTCSISGTTQTCALTMDTLMSIPAPGASSCVSFKDPSSDIVVAELEIKYDFALSRVALQKQYYTSKWVGVGSSNRQCPWEEGCDTSQTCVDFAANTPINPHGLLSGNALLWPGLTECSTSCGCAGCGCFACDNACMYWRYAFQPTTPAWKVEAPHTYTLEPHVSAKLTVQGQSTNASVAITGFQTYIGSNYSVTVVGSLSGDLVIFGQRAVVSSSNGAYLTDVSPVNGPIAGAIGDIQANSANQLMTPSTSAFIFPSGAVDVNIGTSEATFNYPPSGIDSLPEIHKLPLLINGILWTMGSSEIVGLNPNPGTLLINVKNMGTLTISRVVNVVCPKIISVSAQGCYNCQIGSIITVVAKSECSEGLVSVAFTGATVSTTSVYLATNDSTAQINVQPTTAQVTGTLTLGSGVYTDSIEVSWTATVQDAVDTNRTGSNVNGTAQDGDGIDYNWNQFEDWLNSLSPVEQVFFWIGLAGGIIIILVLIGFLVYKFGPFGRMKAAAGYARIAGDALKRV